MLLYERPVYNEKLQQDIDLEGKRGLNALWFKGCRWHRGLCRPSDASRFFGVVTHEEQHQYSSGGAPNRPSVYIDNKPSLMVREMRFSRLIT